MSDHREKVIKEFELFIKEFHPACVSEGVELDMLREVLALLKEQEDLGTEQHPQELVRCKDCKNSGLDSSGINGYWCSAHTEWHNGNWFCGDGERRDDDN